MTVRAVRTRLKPGMEESYERVHESVPLELANRLVQRGDTEWLIFRQGQDLFHVIFTDDPDGAEVNGHAEADAQALPSTEWDRTIAAHLEPVYDDVMSAPMRLVWRLSDNGGNPPSR